MQKKNITRSLIKTNKAAGQCKTGNKLVISISILMHWQLHRHHRKRTVMTRITRITARFAGREGKSYCAISAPKPTTSSASTRRWTKLPTCGLALLVLVICLFMFFQLYDLNLVHKKQAFIKDWYLQKVESLLSYQRT